MFPYGISYRAIDERLNAVCITQNFAYTISATSLNILAEFSMRSQFFSDLNIYFSPICATRCLAGTQLLGFRRTASNIFYNSQPLARIKEC